MKGSTEGLENPSEPQEDRMSPAGIVETLDLCTIRYEDALAVSQLCIETWPHPDAAPEANARRTIEQQQAGAYKPGEHLWYLARKEDLAVASCQTFPRTIKVDGKPMTILALAGVCTRSASRGQGFGSQVVKAAFARVERLEFPFCFFQTTHRNRPFYERLGATRLETRFFNSLSTDPEADPFWDQVAMYFPASRPWPAGAVDTLGPGW
jgi:GNAT superfamily N-acetyltransferase